MTMTKPILLKEDFQEPARLLVVEDEYILAVNLKESLESLETVCKSWLSGCGCPSSLILGQSTQH